MNDFPLFPDQASSVAGDVDALFFFLVSVSAFFGLLIAGLLVAFAVRFRRRSHDEQGERQPSPLWMELTWTLIPLAIVMGIFVWSAELFFRIHRVPREAIEVQVVGKRWMWKLQHVTGQREINQLHVPVGVPVRLTLTSEDVIHSFFVPAFRIKKDAVPGRYSTTWFQATKPGTYHLFCAEYCGTKHSAMLGQIVVMEPAAFQAWLAGGAEGVSLVDAGGRLFEQLACVTCHRPDSEGRGPNLEGVFGHEVRLASGETALADPEYIRESIVAPSARVTAGYQPVMPTYQGLISEEGLLQLIAYIESLGGDADAAPEPSSASVPASPGAQDGGSP